MPIEEGDIITMYKVTGEFKILSMSYDKDWMVQMVVESTTTKIRSFMKRRYNLLTLVKKP